jgi:hypothetical protein
VRSHLLRFRLGQTHDTPDHVGPLAHDAEQACRELLGNRPEDVGRQVAEDVERDEELLVEIVLYAPLEKLIQTAQVAHIAGNDLGEAEQADDGALDQETAVQRRGRKQLIEKVEDDGPVRSARRRTGTAGRPTHQIAGKQCVARPPMLTMSSSKKTLEGS